MIIDWNDSDNDKIEQFKECFTKTGFVRLYNLWSSDELKDINNWFDSVKYWFLNEPNKQKYKAKEDFREGWAEIEKMFTNPRAKNDYKETFEIDHFDEFDWMPPSLASSLKVSHPLFREKSLEVVKLFDLMLETQDNLLYNLFSDPNLHHLRLAYYPGSDNKPSQLPCGAHKDYNSITLLFSPDENKRLQIKNREGQWVDIPYLDNSVVINIGNCLQVWSQDYLHSAFHRVLFNSKDSFTTAYFLELPDDLKLDLIGTNVKKYPTTTVKDFKNKFNISKQVIRERTYFKRKYNDELV